jgi:hypothetical protein
LPATAPHSRRGGPARTPAGGGPQRRCVRRSSHTSAPISAARPVRAVERPSGLVLQAGQAVTLVVGLPRIHRLPGGPVPQRHLDHRRPVADLQHRPVPMLHLLRPARRIPCQVQSHGRPNDPPPSGMSDDKLSTKS